VTKFQCKIFQLKLCGCGTISVEKFYIKIVPPWHDFSWWKIYSHCVI